MMKSRILAILSTLCLLGVCAGDLLSSTSIPPQDCRGCIGTCADATQVNGACSGSCLESGYWLASPCMGGCLCKPGRDSQTNCVCRGGAIGTGD